MEKTKDYDKFKFVLGNREINKYHVNELVDAIKYKNMLDNHPILVNEKFYVIDGQHRLKACQILNIEVPYIIVRNYSEQDIITINTTSKKWNNLDYLEYHVKKQNPTYITIKHLIDNYGVSLSIVLTLSVKTRKGAMYKIFKEGNFEFEDLEFTKQSLNEMKYLRQYFSHWNDRAFAEAYKIVKKDTNFNPEHFLTKVNKFPHLLKRTAGRKEYLELIEKIYNYQQKTYTRIY